MNNNVMIEDDFDIDAWETDVTPPEFEFDPLEGVTLSDIYSASRIGVSSLSNASKVNIYTKGFRWKKYRRGGRNDYSQVWEPSDGDMLAFYNQAPVGRVSPVDGSWISYLDGEFPLSELGESSCRKDAMRAVVVAVMYKALSGHHIS